MIVYTSWNNERDFAELYEEWVGHKPQYKGVQSNSFWYGARDTETNYWVGAAQLLIVEDPIFDRRWGLVESVYVAKVYRRQGIASSLMKGLEMLAFNFGCEFIKLTSRKEEGKSLYRTLGYTEGGAFRKELSADSIWIRR